MCIMELPSGESPESYARFSVGNTPQGIQVWCNRHNANVAHIDFQGQRHPANTTANYNKIVDTLDTIE